MQLSAEEVTSIARARYARQGVFAELPAALMGMFAHARIATVPGWAYAALPIIAPSYGMLMDGKEFG